jgi:hypothetical protein
MTTERESLLKKVRALLAKTIESGCTEGEALAALDRAQAMMAAYTITEDELNLAKEEKAILRREPPGAEDPHRIKWHLLSAVAKFCNCEAWRMGRRGGHALVFCGLPSDADFATWLLDTLTRFVQSELVEHLCDIVPSKGERREVIRSFVIGCTDRISERLDELCEQRKAAAASNTNAKALVVVKDQAIKAKMNELGIHLRSAGGPCEARDNLSYSAGHSAGGRASFGRPVSGRPATLRIGNGRS